MLGKALWVEQPGVDDERISVTWIVTEEMAQAKIPKQEQIVSEAKQEDCVWRGALGCRGETLEVPLARGGLCGP